MPDEEDVDALQRRLGAMERDGQLVRNRRGAFCLVNKMDLIAGRVIGHPDGFGFLVKPDEGGDDLFLSAREMRELMHGDRVVVACHRQRTAAAAAKARWSRCWSATPAAWSGGCIRESGVGFVVPDNKRIHPGHRHPARIASAAPSQGQIVVAEITEQPTKRTQPIGRIVEVLGRAHGARAWRSRSPSAPTTCRSSGRTRSRRRSRGFGAEVPEAAKAGPRGPARAAAGHHRRRRCPRLRRRGLLRAQAQGLAAAGGIADVSALRRAGHRAGRGGAASAATRCTSRTGSIPMLPEVLSNGLCSLNPEVDRLCMVCEMYVNADGKVTRSRFFEAVMRSHARLTYDQVAAMLVERRRRSCASSTPTCCRTWTSCYALYQVLHAARGAARRHRFRHRRDPYRVRRAGQDRADRARWCATTRTA